MKWTSIYKNKVVSPETAVSLVESGNRLYLSGNAAAPYTLMQALANRASELRDVELAHVLLLGDDPLSTPEMRKSFRHNSLFVGSADRKAVNDGRADYVPVHLHQIPRLFTQGILPIDVAVVSASPPDEHGFMSFGVEDLATKAAVETAKRVIVQVNHQMPRTLGDSFMHVSRADAIIEVDKALPELPRKPFTEVESRIGEFIADLINDGDTLQLGIGGIPDAVLKALSGTKRNIGIHTEMVSDGVMEGIESGMITGSNKCLHPSKVVATFILGSKDLYDFVDDNPVFELHPCDYTNDPFVVAKNDNMVAINSAIEIDLTGQVCSDSIGTYIYSGFGGQVDFIRGAAASSGGKPIIAVPSTAKHGTMSRIVPILKQGAGVVTSRADVHYVVTEFGVASLYGKNLKERAGELIRVAHPNFRDELTFMAKERHLL